MVKGISRQVIVVHSPDPKLFEQAIFILKDDALGTEGVSDELLLREAKRLIAGPGSPGGRKRHLPGAFWALSGGLLVGLVWFMCWLF